MRPKNVNQEQLGKTIWAITNQLRGAMDADDFRDYMFSFLFLRYLSDNTDIDTLGDAYEYLNGQFAAGSGKKAGEFYTPQQISDILSTIVTLDSQNPKSGPKKRLDSVLDFACGSGSLLLNVRKRMGPKDIDPPRPPSTSHSTSSRIRGR